MEQSFWIGTHIKNFLFEGYDLTSIWGLLATCLGVSSLAVLYEGGRIYKLHCKSRVFPEADEITNSTNDTATLMTSCSETTSSRLSPVDRLCHAAKYTVFCVQNELIGYLLMLSVMKLNLAIALAVWFGAGLGYFVFAANISDPNSDGLKQQSSRGRNVRSVSPSPPEDGDSTTEKFTESNAGDQGEDIWRTEAGQQPVTSDNQHLTDTHDHFPDDDGDQGGVITATVIVHREPSSQN